MVLLVIMRIERSIKQYWVKCSLATYSFTLPLCCHCTSFIPTRRKYTPLSFVCVFTVTKAQICFSSLTPGMLSSIKISRQITFTLLSVVSSPKLPTFLIFATHKKGTCKHCTQIVLNCTLHALFKIFPYWIHYEICQKVCFIVLHNQFKYS